MKKFKKRWRTKLNGLSNSRYCHPCLSYGCDPIGAPETIATRKRRSRRIAKLCEGCGKKECECKNTNSREWRKI